MGKRNNQNFVGLPLLKLVEMIRYKAKMVGMLIYRTDEAYTSKCSSVDNEPVGKHEKYAGKRLSRGRFKTADGTIINADVNGAANIVRKVIPNAFARGIEGVRLSPYSVTI
jgi:putative transposase